MQIESGLAGSLAQRARLNESVYASCLRWSCNCRKITRCGDLISGSGINRKSAMPSLKPVCLPVHIMPRSPALWRRAQPLTPISLAERSDQSVQRSSLRCLDKAAQICDLILENLLEELRVDFNHPAPVGNELEYIRQAIESAHISGDGAFTKKCHALWKGTWCTQGFANHLLHARA